MVKTAPNPQSIGWGFVISEAVRVTVSVQPPELTHDDMFIDVGGSMSDNPSHPISTTDQPLDDMSRTRARRSSASFWPELRGLYCRQHDLRSQRLNYWRERLGYPIKTLGGCFTTYESRVRLHSMKR